MNFKELFYEVLEEIRDHYPTYRFIVERDLVWTIQKKLQEKISTAGLDYIVFSDYPIKKGSKRSLAIDIAIVRKDVSIIDVLEGITPIELGVEFKFEPSKKREEILSHKGDVVDWNKVLKDINRIEEFISENKAKACISIFIDEYGRYFKEHYSYPSVATWIDWGTYSTEELNVKVLLTDICLHSKEK